MTESTCLIADCGKPPCNSRGWCNAHYMRFRTHGDPLGGGPPKVVSWAGATCMSPRCTRKVRCKGLCASHYNMWLTYGRISEITTEDRFWSKVVEGDDGCWLWTSASNYGYGNFYFETRDGGSPSNPYVGAHRFAYESMRGEIPPGLHLDHLCRVTLCVNPWHLEPVSPEENGRRKGIAWGLTGLAAIRMIDGYYTLRSQILSEARHAAHYAA